MERLYAVLADLYHLPTGDLANSTTWQTPAELYAGFDLVMPVGDEVITATQRAVLTGQQSLLELSVLSKVNPWKIVGANTLSGSGAHCPICVLTARRVFQGLTLLKTDSSKSDCCPVSTARCVAVITSSPTGITRSKPA